jgi:transposase
MTLVFLLVRHIFHYNFIPKEALLTPSPKRDRLRRQGVLNPRPERVKAPWFQTGEFFDADDLIQVKYEMLRHVQTGGASKAVAAALFGMSRPTFYQAEAAFAQEGLTGLVPKMRGPKGAHKLGAEVMAFIEAQIPEGGPLQARALAARIEAELGLRVHPRSIERAIARKKKR